MYLRNWLYFPQGNTVWFTWKRTNTTHCTNAIVYVHMLPHDKVPIPSLPDLFVDTTRIMAPASWFCVYGLNDWWGSTLLLHILSLPYSNFEVKNLFLLWIFIYETFITTLSHINKPSYRKWADISKTPENILTINTKTILKHSCHENSNIVTQQPYVSIMILTIQYLLA